MYSGFIQIAGVKDWEDSKLLMDEGVDAIGFPLGLPIHKEDLTISETYRIVKKLKNQVIAILITYFNKAERIHEICQATGIETIQIHGKLSIVEIKKLIAFDPKYILIKSLVVKGDNFNELIQVIIQLSPFVKGFIADTHNPITGADGATGKTHDWNISRQLVEKSKHPVILAGGLNPKNIELAITRVKPSGVDVHTGVEGKGGRKDKDLVRKFVHEAKLAFSQNI